MAIKTFGLGQTYPFDATYWSTLTRVQETNVSAITAADGWMVLALSGSGDIESTSWPNLIGWTISGTTTEISPAGQLHQIETDAGGNTYCNKAHGTDDQTFSVMTMLKVDVPGVSTSNVHSGCFPAYKDGNETHFMNIRSDGSNFDIYAFDNPYVKHDTSRPADTRWHIYGFYNDNSAGNTVVTLDGEEVATGCETFTESFTINRPWLFKHATDDGDVECHYDWLEAFSSIIPWHQTDGVMESDGSHATYDAGAGRRWAQVDWTDDTSNSTAITYEVKCGDSAGAGTYETISSSGDPIVTKGRYITIKITMADASSGRYTPILKTLTITDEAVPAYTVKSVGLGRMCK